MKITTISFALLAAHAVAVAIRPNPNKALLARADSDSEDSGRDSQRESVGDTSDVEDGEEVNSYDSDAEQSSTEDKKLRLKVRAPNDYDSDTESVGDSDDPPDAKDVDKHPCSDAEESSTEGDCDADDDYRNLRA